MARWTTLLSAERTGAEFPCGADVLRSFPSDGVGPGAETEMRAYWLQADAAIPTEFCKRGGIAERRDYVVPAMQL